MEFWWLLIGAVILAAVLLMPNRSRRPWHRQKVRESLGPQPDTDRVAGDQAELWPDRTGPQTKKELGARTVGYEGQLSPAEEQRQAEDLTWQYLTPDVRPDQSDGKPPSRSGPAKEASIASPPGHEAARPGSGQPGAKLQPEAEFGESRPARRTSAPDQPPNMWEPEQSGAPGTHIRDGGHHRSATAPTKRSDIGDPFAHAPVYGPNHVTPEGGDSLPPDTRP